MGELKHLRILCVLSFALALASRRSHLIFLAQTVSTTIRVPLPMRHLCNPLPICLMKPLSLSFRGLVVFATTIRTMWIVWENEVHSMPPRVRVACDLALTPSGLDNSILMNT
jgi:hypothetical protein